MRKMEKEEIKNKKYSFFYLHVDMPTWISNLLFNTHKV